MKYRNRKIATHNKKVMDFIRQLREGEHLIPTFQRLFVWAPESISALWNSIYHFYPVGSILCWRTRTQLHVHRQLGGFFVPDQNVRRSELQSYILDGQQRATSLLVSFEGGAGRVREQPSFDYTLYFDLTRADFFFEKDYYRHRWDAESALLLRLKEVPDLPADYCDRLAGAKGFVPEVQKNLEQLRYMLAEYTLPLINLEGYEIEDVCAIFERINQTGERLKNMDILIARGFKNYATVVEEDFPVA